MNNAHKISRKIKVDTFITEIGSIAPSLNAITPSSLRIKAPFDASNFYRKAGSTYFSYKIMSSAYRLFPSILAIELYGIRSFIEVPGVIDAISKNIPISTWDYLVNMGMMASGDAAMRVELAAYTEHMSEIILMFVFKFIGGPRAPRTANLHALTDWSGGCQLTNSISHAIQEYLRCHPLTPLPPLSADMLKLTATRTDHEMQALETLGDRALDYFFQELVATIHKTIRVNPDVFPRVRDIMLSNKILSIIGAKLGGTWDTTIPTVPNIPSDGTIIKLAADIFEARVGAVISRPHGHSEFECWWFENMSGILRFIIHEMENSNNLDRTSQKRKQSDDLGGSSVKRMRRSVTSFRLPTYGGKENHPQPQQE